MLGQQDLTPISVEEVTSRFEASTLGVADLVTAAVAVIVGFALGAIARSAVRRLLSRVRGVQRATATAIARIVGYVIVVLGFVVALSALGLDFGPVITILLMIALITILVGRPMLADLGAGVVIQSRGPVSVGAVIRTEDYEGVVEDINGRVVQIRTWDGWDVRVRNSDILTDPMVTVADVGRIRDEFVIGIHYDSDLDAAVDVVASALASTDGVLADPPPQALVTEFGESTIDIRCLLWVDPAQRPQTHDAAMRGVKHALDHEQIVIAYPQRVVRAA